MFGLQKHRTGAKEDLFSEAIFSLPHQIAGLRTLFNPIKDELF